MRAWLQLTCCAVISLHPISVSADDGQFSQRSAKQEVKRTAAVGKLTPEGVAKLATIKDDAMEPFVRISTEAAFKWRGGFTDPVRADNFMRASLSRDGEVVLYQLYQTVAYMHAVRRFDQVNVMLPSGLKTLPLTIISSKVDCTYGCVYTDDVAFSFTQDEMDQIASLYAEDPRATIKLRFKSSSSLDWNDDIAAVEVVGLIQAVKAWKATARPRE